MYEELRLHSLGFPLEDALTLCDSLRKEGTLKQFVEELEDQHRREFAYEVNICSLIKKSES